VTIRRLSSCGLCAGRGYARGNSREERSSFARFGEVAVGRISTPFRVILGQVCEAVYFGRVIG
jgi:hypothetical protein